MQDMGAWEEQKNGDGAAVHSAVTKVCPGKMSSGVVGDA